VDPHPLRHVDLIPHQRKKRTDNQSRAGTGISPNPGGNPIDEAFAPACPLDNQNPATGTEDGLDGLSLARTESSARPEGGLKVALENIADHLGTLSQTRTDAANLDVAIVIRLASRRASFEISARPTGSCGSCNT
jgi:hypothetical protein